MTADDPLGSDHVHIVDPEMKIEIWRCSNGHEIKQTAPWNAEANPSHDPLDNIGESGPICQLCFVRWLGKTFPIHKRSEE